MKRKEIFLSKVTAMNQESYTKSEEISGLDKLSEQMFDISNAIGDGCHKYLDFVVKSFIEWNKENHKIPEDLLQRFSKNCSLISKQQIHNKCGIIAEKHVSSQLEAFTLRNNGYKILSNIELEYDGLEGEFDDILITDKAIFVIEVKSLSGNATINKNGHLQIKDKKVDYQRNIADQLNNEFRLLWATLKNANGLENVNSLKIETIIVNEKENSEITNHCKEIKTLLHLHEVTSYIEEYNGESIYDEKAINSIYNYIINKKVKLTHKLAIDIAQVKEDFAEIMSIINPDIDFDSVNNTISVIDEPIETVNENKYEDTLEKNKLNFGIEILKAIGFMLLGATVTKVAIDYNNEEGIWKRNKV